jgi:hypothetical protein
MQTLTVRKAALAALVPLALGSLTACGGGSSSGAADAPASQSTPSGTSSDSTSGDSSSPADPQSSSTSSGDDQSSAAAGSSVSGADFIKLMQTAASKLTTVKVTMNGDASGQSYSMKGQMDLTGSKPAMDMTMNMASSGMTGIEMRLVDDVMYMKLGSMTQGKYVKVDLNDPNGPLGSLSSSLDSLDPTKMMGEMSPDAFTHVTYVGSDANGKHYKATLDTSKAPQLKGLPSSATANLPKTMGYDIWLDSEGRFSKFIASVPNFLKMSATYSDYGAPVHIAAPPASQVTTMPGTSSTS